MRSLLSLATVALFVVVSESMKIYGVSEADVYACFHYMACEIFSVSDLKSITDCYGPESHAKALEIFREATGWEDADDDAKTWEEYPDRLCVESAEDKENIFQSITSKLAEYWSQVCEEENEVECEGFNEAATIFGSLVSELSAKRKCGSSAKAKDTLGPATIP